MRNYYLLCFSVCLFTCLINSSATEVKCSASDNVKWNRNKRKCVSCQDCPPGQFRNLTEPYTRRSGNHGVEQCLPCRPCPMGMFSETGQGECIKCRMNCTEMNREYDETCSSLHDARCGSCLTNFEDTYGHTLLPCSPKKSLKLLNTDKDKPNQLQPLPDDRSNQQEYAVQADTHSSHDKGNVSHGSIIAIVTGAATALILISFVITSAMIRKRNRAGQGQYNQVSILSRENDIETDAGHSDDTAPKTHYQSRMANDAVRPELSLSLQPLARPELSQPAQTQQLGGIIQTLRLSDGSVVSFQRNKDICACRVQPSCKCEECKFPEHSVEKSDEYMTIVASEVCHDPLPLFRVLGLRDPVLYQENDTRDRDPENITQKELVIRLLNIWIESKPTPNTLQQLSEALCKSDFHNINKTLYDLYVNNSNDISP